MFNPHSDIAYNWQCLPPLDERNPDYNEASEFLGHNPWDGCDVFSYWISSPYSDCCTEYIEHKVNFAYNESWLRMSDYERYFSASNRAHWSDVRENDRLFREGKSGYSMGDGILKKWTDK